MKSDYRIGILRYIKIEGGAGGGCIGNQLCSLDIDRMSCDQGVQPHPVFELIRRGVSADVMNTIGIVVVAVLPPALESYLRLQLPPDGEPNQSLMSVIAEACKNGLRAAQ
jgi:hypothetical protein